MVDRCERCWGRAGLESFVPEGGRPSLLCRSCRAAAPQDPLMFREVFLRFSSTKEMVSHYEARDEEEALRKLCNEKRLDFRSVIRAIESHGRAEPSNGFLDFSRPYGYEMRDGGLRVRPEEARTVGLIFEWYVEGKGIAKICRELNGAKVTTKTGKEWASQTVANILRNPLYCGYTKEDGSLRTGKHRRIVDPEMFSRVQVEMQKRIRRPDQRQESKLLREDRKVDRR